MDPDLEIGWGGGGRGSAKKFFRPFGPQFRLKISLDSPLRYQSGSWGTYGYVGEVSALLIMTKKMTKKWQG